MTERGPWRHGVAMLVVGGVLISLSAVFVRLADVGPSVSGFYRNVFGAAALFALVGLRRESVWRGPAPLGLAFVAAVFFAGDIFFWHRSIHYVGPGLATIMANGQVFVLALVGALAFHEQVSRTFWVAVFMAIVGLALLVGADWMALDATYRKGVVFGLLTAVTYAGYLLSLRRAQRSPVRLSSAAGLAWVTTFTALLLWGVVEVEGETLRVPDARTWTILVIYGVVCQGVAWAIISRALRSVDASRAGLLLLLQPTLTFVWDIVLFRRPTSVVEGFGAALALAAIHLGSTRRRTP